MIDCEKIIAGLTGASDAIVSACISRSGMHESAEAARFAANLTSLRTLIGGSVALGGALIVVAIQTRPARLERSRKTQAFRRLTLHSSSSFKSDLSSPRRNVGILLPVEADRIDEILRAFEKLELLSLPPSLSYTSWQDASLLTDSEYAAIVQLQAAIDKYNKYLITMMNYVGKISVKKRPLQESAYSTLRMRVSTLSGRLSLVVSKVDDAVVAFMNASLPMHEKIGSIAFLSRKWQVGKQF